MLDMLRYLIDGAEATSHPASQHELFFQALHHYLVGHHARDADTPELIKSIQEATGDRTPASWFFPGEWVFMAGRPDYRVAASYDGHKKRRRKSPSPRPSEPMPRRRFLAQLPIELGRSMARMENGRKIRVRDNLQQQEVRDSTRLRAAVGRFRSRQFHR